MNFFVLFFIIAFAFLIHELGHWVVARYYKLNIGFIHIYKYGGLNIEIKPCTLKQGFLISFGGYFATLLFYPIFFFVGFEEFILWAMLMFGLPVVDYVHWIFYLLSIKKYGWNYKKKGNSWNLSFDIKWQLDKKMVEK